MRPLSIAFFERVPALPGTALVRLAGRVDPSLAGGEEPVLVVDDGRTAREFDALKAPDRFDARSGAFVLPFAVPVEALGRRPAYALRVDGQLLDLPTPREHKLRDPVEHAATNGSAAPAVERATDAPVAEVAEQPAAEVAEELDARVADPLEAEAGAEPTT
ncbi:MAG TPA: hypothetical protein VGW10_12270, partial [Solirubrobacteraceae bacterium]|nr:hypothetical protein [Solirubrobacteraceae bacterium]